MPISPDVKAAFEACLTQGETLSWDDKGFTLTTPHSAHADKFLKVWLNNVVERQPRMNFAYINPDKLLAVYYIF